MCASGSCTNFFTTPWCACVTHNGDDSWDTGWQVLKAVWDMQVKVHTQSTNVLATCSNTIVGTTPSPPEPTTEFHSSTQTISIILQKFSETSVEISKEFGATWRKKFWSWHVDNIVWCGKPWFSTLIMIKRQRFLTKEWQNIVLVPTIGKHVGIYTVYREIAQFKHMHISRLYTV